MPGYKKSKQKRRPRKKTQTPAKKDVNTQKAKVKPGDITTASTPEMKLHDIDDRQQSTWYATTDSSVMAASSSDVQRESKEAKNPDDDEYKQDALSEISDFSTRSSEFEVLWKKYQTGDEAAPNEAKQGKETKFGYESSDGASGFVEMRRSKKFFDDSAPALGPMAEVEESAIKGAPAEDSSIEDPKKILKLMMSGKKEVDIGKENAQKGQIIAPSGDIERPVGGTLKQTIPMTTKANAPKYIKTDDGPKTTRNQEDKVQDLTKSQEKSDNINDVVPKSSGAISKKINKESGKKKKKSNKKKKSIDVKIESIEVVNPKDDKEDSPFETSAIITQSSKDKGKQTEEVAVSNKNKQDDKENTSVDAGFTETTCDKKDFEDTHGISSTSPAQELIVESQEKTINAEIPDPPIGDPRKLIKWVISGQKLACTFKISPYAPRNFAEEEDTTVNEGTLNTQSTIPTEETVPNDETKKVHLPEDAKGDNTEQSVCYPKDKVQEQKDTEDKTTKTNNDIREIPMKSTEDLNELESCKKKKSIKKNTSGTINSMSDKSDMSNTSKKYQIDEANQLEQTKQGNDAKIGSESLDSVAIDENRCAKKHDDYTEERTLVLDPVIEVEGLQGGAIPSAVPSNNDPDDKITDDNEGVKVRIMKVRSSNEEINPSEKSKTDNTQDTMHKPEDKGTKKKCPKIKKSTEIVKKQEKVSSGKIDAKSAKMNKKGNKKKKISQSEVKKENAQANMPKKEEFKHETVSEMSDASTRSSEFDLFKKHQIDEKVIPSENKKENEDKLVPKYSDTTGFTEMESTKPEPMSKVAKTPENEESDEEYYYRDPEKVIIDDVAIVHSDEEAKKTEEEILKSMFDLKTCKKKKCHKRNKRLLRELRMVDMEAAKSKCNKQDSLSEDDPGLLSQNKQDAPSAGCKSSDGAGVAEMGCAKKHSVDPQHEGFTATVPMTEDAESSSKLESSEDTSLDEPKQILQQTFIDNFKVVEHVSDNKNISNMQIVTPTAKSEDYINQTTSNEEANMANPLKEDNEKDTANNSEDKDEEQSESKNGSDNTNDNASENCEKVLKEIKQATKDFFTVKSCKSMKKWCKKKKNALRSPGSIDAKKSISAVEKPIKKSEKTDVHSSNVSTNERPGTSTENNTVNMQAPDELTNKDPTVSTSLYKPPPSDIKPLIIHVSSSCSFSTSSTSSTSPTSNTKVVNLQQTKNQFIKTPASRKNNNPKVRTAASLSKRNLPNAIKGAMTVQRFQIEGIPREYCTPSYISSILKTREFGINFSKPTEELLVRGNSVFIKTADRSFGSKINNFGNVIGHPVKVSKVAEYKIPDIHFSCVIRGVHKTISAEEIYNVLCGDNFKINRVYRIISSKTGSVTRYIRVIAYNKRTIDDLLQYGVKIFGELYRCEPSDTPVKKQNEAKTPETIPEKPTLYGELANNPIGNKEIIRNMTMALIDKIPPSSKSILLKLKNDGKRIQIGIADDVVELDPKEWPSLH